jgi:hypothetical protein
VYRGNKPTQSGFIDGTNTGSLDSTNVSFTLYPGMKVTGVWTGGDPGATATMTLVGDNQVPR